jgi:hypothetical protein
MVKKRMTKEALMRLSILAAVAVSLMAVVPAFADESTTTTTTTVESNSLPYVASPAPVVITPAPAIIDTPTVVTPAPTETIVVKKKDKHLLRVGVPFLFHVNVF